MKVHHAPWSRKYRTHWLKGQYAYELQVGSYVFQLFYQPSEFPRTSMSYYSRFHVWRDQYTNYPKYRRSALWGVS